MAKNQVLTSVKIDKDLWEENKIACIKNKFSFTKISEKVLYLYNTSEDFRRMIHNTKVEVKEK